MRCLGLVAGIILVCGISGAQYTREWQSGNLGTSAWGASYGYDVDGDGVPNLWTRGGSSLTIHNPNYSVYWTFSMPSYSYLQLATPRDIDGDGLVEPVNLDGDGNGEVVVSAYRLDGSAYYGRIRVYDAVTRNLEWESSEISGFTGYASVDDVDGDNKHEIVISRYDYTGGWGYVEVYGYSGAGIDGTPQYRQESSQAVAIPSISGHGAEVRFVLVAAGLASLTVFDSAGRMVRGLLDAPLPAGEYRVRWDGTDDQGRSVPAGVYTYRLDRGSASESGQVVLMR